MPPLAELLAYEHPAVVRRFKKDHPDHAAKAETLFKDLLRFFWASKQLVLKRQASPDDPELDFVFIMDEEMRAIDQMWHVFLLYTQDYMDFCQRYFGEYLHHLPDVVPALNQKGFDFERNLTKFLSYVYDTLGVEVVERWFAGSIA